MRKALRRVMSSSGLMLLATVSLLSGCGGDAPPAAPDTSADATATTASAEAPATLEATDTTWTPVP